MKALIFIPHDTLLGPQGALKRLGGLIDAFSENELVFMVPRTAADAEILRGKKVYTFDEPAVAGRRIPYLLDFTSRWVTDLERAAAAEAVDIVVFNFPWGLAKASKRIKLPLVYFSQGIERDFTEITLRHLGLPRGLLPPARSFVGALERRACRAASLVVTMSEADAKRAAELYRVVESKLFPFPQPVTFGRTAFNRERVRASLAIPPDAPVVFFHGSYSHLPNREAIDNLRSSVVPQLRAALPGVQCIVAGNGVPEFSEPGIRGIGYREDLSELIQSADVAAVPVVSGCGVRMKIFDYFQAGTPCVSTRKGMEGLALTDGRELLITKNEMSDFTEQLIRLLGDTGLRTTLAEGAKQYLAEQHDEKTVRAGLRARLDGLLSGNKE